MTPAELMRDTALAFSRGDLQPLFALVDDQTVWKAASIMPGPFRFHGTYEKRAGVVEVTSLIAMQFQMRRFHPKEIVGEGEVVWGHFEIEAEYRPTGKIIQFDAAIRWRVVNGRLREHQGFFDTAAVIALQLEKPPV